MRFYTELECEQWLTDRNRQKPQSTPDRPDERISYPCEPYRIYGLAHWIASSLTHRKPALLWITEWDIWPSSENLHLYYRLRESYGDGRLLHEAPGHFFLAHESEDLASFLQIAMLNGWGGFVLTEIGYVNAFFSHDEYVDFFAENESCMEEVREALGKFKPIGESIGRSGEPTPKDS